MVNDTVKLKVDTFGIGSPVFEAVLDEVLQVTEALRCRDIPRLLPLGIGEGGLIKEEGGGPTPSCSNIPKLHLTFRRQEF
jgi:hypothetical protein